MRYEYKYVMITGKYRDDKTVDLVNQALNKYGNEGWELVNFTYGTIDGVYHLVFKRDKE